MTTKETKMPSGIEAKRLDDLPAGKATTTLIYGDSKTGKTEFIGTAGSRMLYIYFTIGEGISTLQSPGFKRRYPNCNPIVVPIRETEATKAFDAVKQVIDYHVDNKRNEFDVVAVDEMTAFRRHAMWKGLEISSIEERSKTWDKAQNRKDLPKGFFIPGIQDFGMEMGLTEWWVATYTADAKEQGYHLLVAAHSRHIYEKSGKGVNDAETLKAIKPGFTGKTFPDDVTCYFDSVFYMERVGRHPTAKYNLRLMGDEIVTAGTRYGGVFVKNGKEVESITNPNFPEMIKKISQSGKEPTGTIKIGGKETTEQK